MTERKSLLLCCALAIPLTAVQRPTPDRAAPGSLVLGAVEVQDDSWTLLPLASVTGSTWRNTWPPPTENQRIPRLQDIPVSWLGKSVPERWTVWSNSQVIGHVTVLGTSRLRTRCEAPVTLQVSPLGSAVSERPLLAVETDQVVEGFLTPTGAERSRGEDVLRAAFVDAELGIAHDPGHRETSEDNLRKLPITIRALFRPARETGPVIYRFEAVRRGRDSRGPYGIAVEGWLLRKGAQVSPFGLKARYFWGDEDPDAGEGPVLLPIGLLRLDGHVFWVSRLQGIEAYSYAIDRVEPRAIQRVLEIFAGGC